MLGLRASEGLTLLRECQEDLVERLWTRPVQLSDFFLFHLCELGEPGLPRLGEPGLPRLGERPTCGGGEARRQPRVIVFGHGASTMP
jgi:hypothetical protein